MGDVGEGVVDAVVEMVHQMSSSRVKLSKHLLAYFSLLPGEQG